MVAAPPATPQQQPQGGGRRSNYRGGGHKQQRRANGGGACQQHQPSLSWTYGTNPWTGVIHAYSMPVPRPPAPCILGPRPASHQAYLTAPGTAPYAAPTLPASPAMGGYDATPAPPYGGFYPPQVPPPWDPALLAALHSAPSPSNYGGGGDWYMDLGATAHMKSHPVTNLVFVRRLARENPITVEFDDVGFSVKDARTRMVPSLPAQLSAPPAARLAPAITNGRPPPSLSSALAPCPVPSGLAAPFGAPDVMGSAAPSSSASGEAA
nr:predicted GPI-anchored protein 58 [Aegilops tauschii subsp. strangulata]